jgi:hypothetical protein
MVLVQQLIFLIQALLPVQCSKHSIETTGFLLWYILKLSNCLNGCKQRRAMLHQLFCRWIGVEFLAPFREAGQPDGSYIPVFGQRWEYLPPLGLG